MHSRKLGVTSVTWLLHATAISFALCGDLFCFFFMNLVKDALHDLLVSSGDVLAMELNLQVLLATYGSIMSKRQQNSFML